MMTDTAQEGPIGDFRENGLGVADQFERHRRYLTGLAYRMLGSMVEAEDAVQEAYIRWHECEKGSIGSARAFLAKIVVRICLDQMKSARAKRETYVGSWLPEPVLNAETLGAETASEYAADLSVGLMLALERLSPLERAAFLLHDVFDVGFDEVAASRTKRSSMPPAGCTGTRAHPQIRSAIQVEPDKGGEILQAFMKAYRTGDIDALANILAEDAVLHTDGGGKRRAALNPIVGRAKILALLVARKRREPLGDFRPATINGLPGCLATLARGDILTIALELVSDRIRAIYVVRNPDKLKHVCEEVERESS
jgi:RNA polymerase sigma-70 factor (ECF subfamily)